MKFVRENPDIVKENIKKKFQDYKLPLVNEVLMEDKELRQTQQHADDLRANRKKISKEIGKLMGQGKKEEAEEIKQQMAEIAHELTALEEKEIKLKDGINIIYGKNESGKSTILEAIHVALTGMYAGRNIRNQLSTYLFNREAVEEYLASVENGQPIAPPEIMIELYFKSGTLPEYRKNGNSEKSDGIEGIRFTISFF